MQRVIKRTADFLAALIGLTLLSPLLAVTAFLVRINMGHPVFFRQERPGYKGRLFTMVKFRTMRDAHDARGNPLPDSERLTALGRFLRKTSIDELPELWNVLTGDMSLVGPRPLLTEYLDLYNEEQARRHDALPGITGWAQVNGRNAISWEQKFEYDVWYVDHASPLLDLRILFTTFAKVLQREGITQSGSATVEKFTGTKDAGDRSEEETGRP